MISLKTQNSTLERSDMSTLHAILTRHKEKECIFVGESCPFRSASWKNWKIGFIAVEANVLGVAILYIFARFIIHTQRVPSHVFADNLFMLVYCLASFPTVILSYLGYNAPVRKFLKLTEKGEPCGEELTKVAQERTLNLPVAAAMMTFLGWGLGALCYPLWMFAYDSSVSKNLVIEGAFSVFTTADITLFIVFFKLENLVRRWLLPSVFPKGDVLETRRVFRLSLFWRFLILWYAINFIPIFIFSTSPLMEVYNRFPQARTDVFPYLLKLLPLLGLTGLGAGVFLSVLIASSISKPVKAVTHGMELVRNGSLDVMVPVESVDETGKLSQGFNEMVKGLKEREFIKDTFGRYVSREVMEAILRGNMELGGEKREVTILFSDLRDFTRMTDHMSAEDVVKSLNEYLTAMVDAILENGGVPDKFMGDGIMAVFGAPNSHGTVQDAVQAVKTAIAMKEKLSALNMLREQKDQEPLRMGIGIHTGQVVVGNIGHLEKREYTAIGDAVNVTSRIEALNKELKTEILISDRTCVLTEECLSVQEKGSYLVKGKEEPVLVYEVLGERPKAVEAPEEKEKVPQGVAQPRLALEG